jgi:putative iron-regulated protein
MRVAAIILGGLLALTGCSESPEPVTPTEQDKAPAAEAPAPYAELNRWYSERAGEQTRTLGIRARTLREATRGLLQEPQTERLATARQAWQGLYDAYNAAFVPLHVRAMLDPTLIPRLERVDPVPIFPGYIDGLSQWPDSGIVNDVTVPMTEQALIAQQGATASGEVSLGFQVVHFLLHGEPGQSRQAESLTVEAEVPEDSSLTPEQLPQNRRRDYLRLAVTILTRDLEVLAAKKSVEVTPLTLTESLQQLTQKLIRLENLQNADQVAGEYMAPAVREQALETLLASLRLWGAEASPLMQALAAHDINTGTLETLVAGLEAPGDVAALQNIHARLVDISEQLRAGRP